LSRTCGETTSRNDSGVVRAREYRTADSSERGFSPKLCDEENEEVRGVLTVTM
jgi:hypothetical protein